MFIKKYEIPQGLRVIDIVLDNSASIEKLKSQWEGGNLATSYAKFYYVGFNYNPSIKLTSYDRDKQNNFHEIIDSKRIISREDLSRVRAFINNRKWHSLKRKRYCRKLDDREMEE